ncbi:carbohydrate porin [Curvibacter sp. HBC28]|uniref:Carbohydrate porin n=1 Tax=Curvibacter microcysteis TaxID=3026419 RepID=A0ABT5MF73_9BURK|nr:carbohydrate porin [Curvibacter sp. HBC28]MDD0815035.1 carbohydrate porin [Curvibacter sp. HBC28]
MKNRILKPLGLLACTWPLLWGGLASAADESAGAADTEQAMARFQSTYIWQKKSNFSAAYSGPNSLIPRSERSYTLTFDGYFGFRPWQNAELYFVPEITQGLPLSNLTGLGGFTSGEATRVSGTNPTLYRQKLFLRQTWNQGGGQQRVDADVDQLAGFVDRDRVVLTAGNFSTLDIFDDNLYAKDPRSQFLNWSGMSHLAYDYAADARGFGWGAALEWYTGDWVLRAGRMTGPTTPNGLPTDLRIFKHYGDQVEVEHAHTLAGQPGKVRVLAWRSRALLSSYAEALAYGQANPNASKEWISAVRNGDKTKYGLGLNVEQAVNDRSGVFLRAMKGDGKTETYAFAEADASFSTGYSTRGTAWSRDQDTLGLMYARNMLSADRRKYLAAGGISFFIGDGALRYRPETLFEVYYNMKVSKGLWVSLDYQRIANPAYNADRGPVNVGSVRLHAEF